MAAPEAQRAAARGWGPLQEDLLGCIAALLPLRERFGVLPLVCRHYYEASRRWEIAGLGIFELYTPATPLSTQGIARRCRSLDAWLDSHAAQLARSSFDLPPGCRPGSSIYEMRTAATAVQAAIMPAVEKAAWRHRAAFASLVLSGANLAAALAAAAAGQAPAGSSLAPCVALRSLEIHNFEGSPTQLAQLLGALPHRPALRLHYGRVIGAPHLREAPTLLLQGPPAEPVCAALQRLHIGCSADVSSDLIPGLLAFSALTCMHLALPRELPFLPEGISQLRHLADLRVTGSYNQQVREVPASLAHLPLTTLRLSICRFPADTLIQRRLGGLPTTLQSLAPTLQELQLHACNHCSFPLVVSTMTRLTCLSIRSAYLGGVPAWLTRLQCLEHLEVVGHESCPVSARVDSLPRLHALKWGGRALEEVPGREYLGRLTRLELGATVDFSWNQPIKLGLLQGASRLEALSINGYNDSGPSTLLGVDALDGLPSLIKLELKGVGGARVPPEGAYLSRLRSLDIDGFEEAQLPAGLSTATGLMALKIDNHHMSLDALWEDLEGLLPQLPLLQELSIKEHGDMELQAEPLLVAELLGRE